MTNKANLLNQYIKCAEISSRIDYGNKASVKANNRAVDKMYKIVEKSVALGQPAVDELAALLDDPLCAPWLAHQLLEKATVKPEIQKKCLDIIRKLAGSAPPGDKMGEQTWLKKWYEDHPAG